MPTTYSDQFFQIDPGVPPATNTILTPTNYSYIDNNDDGIIGTGVGDTINGGTVTSVWAGDTITVIMNGSTVTITGVTFYISGQPALFTPTDGTDLSSASFQSSTFVSTSTEVDITQLVPVCFTPGTLIDTPDGRALIEDLSVGDLVNTRDHGAQPIIWIGRQTVPATGEYAPIRFTVGSLGNTEDLSVSPQHRMLVTGWRAEMLFGAKEVLVAAKHLVNDKTIRTETGSEVTYIHLLFAQHEIITAAGAPSESYHPTYAANRDELAAKELAHLYPDLESDHPEMATARPSLKAYEAKLLTPK